MLGETEELHSPFVGYEEARITTEPILQHQVAADFHVAPSLYGTTTPILELGSEGGRNTSHGKRRL